MKYFLLILMLGLTSLRASAQKVFAVDYASQANLKVFVVVYESQAGWRTAAKKHLLY